MNTTTTIEEEVSLMSTIAVGHGFGSTRSAARRPAAARPAAGHPVRLTRRGRLVLFLGFIALALAVLTVFGSQSAATGEAGEPVPTRTVVVTEGQTLWGIASEVAEPGQVREMIHQIQELNALSSAGLAEGQRLAVPVS